ncbi:MAG: stage V sporulation protein R [Paenibacillaceae bacterium ZCTH02-B3]|nr:MAG: stage V sporulation protein R [Paenibacillaceae bacterium ZCTH02-B3]
MTSNEELRKLEEAIGQITDIARNFGLDFFPMRYEICPADILYTFGAYGMPTRFSHWSFGKAFHRLKLQYDLGLSKIYELVINSDPCYAFLLEGNSLVQNKLIVAHVLAHSDFFKNNVRFSRTNRNMVESMAATAERIRQYEIVHGAEEVEKFLDAAMSIQEHIDPSLIQPGGLDKKRRLELKRKLEKERRAPAPPGPYDDLWKLDPEWKDRREDDSTGTAPGVRREPPFPPEPEKDLVWFIQEYSRALDDWQRDIMSMLRAEMLYFWPQLETKIMNEGWATYWHQRIMRELPLDPDEAIEYAKLHASVVQPYRHTVNPYLLGLKIFEDIEKRCGESALFEVRELESDMSFLRNHLTRELTEELDLYVFGKEGTEWKIADKSWESVRDRLVESRVNCGFPYLEVLDGNWRMNGELYIRHRYEGAELDLKYVEGTMPHVARLWGKPVHLETVVDGKTILFTCDGQKTTRRVI